MHRDHLSFSYVQAPILSPTTTFFFFLSLNGTSAKKKKKVIPLKVRGFRIVIFFTCIDVRKLKSARRAFTFLFSLALINGKTKVQKTHNLFLSFFFFQCTAASGVLSGKTAVKDRGLAWTVSTREERV